MGALFDISMVLLVNFRHYKRHNIVDYLSRNFCLTSRFTVCSVRISVLIEFSHIFTAHLLQIREGTTVTLLEPFFHEVCVTWQDKVCLVLYLLGAISILSHSLSFIW